jgi:hypothetical protein
MTARDVEDAPCRITRNATEQEHAMVRPIMFAAVLSLGFLLADSAAAESSREAPETPATHHHGLPGNNPGFDGSSANPDGKGNGKNGGGGIHGIDNVPGHNSANYPGADGTPGFASQLGTVHGGLGGGGHGNH